MNPPSNRFWLNFTVAAISCAVSFMMTIITIIGFGWKAHREIMNDVATMQAQTVSLLEKTLIEKIGTKMDAQPNSYQLQLQDRELNSLKNEVATTNVRIGAMEGQLREIKSLVSMKK